MLSTNFVPGSPAWLDLNAPDLDEAAAFYGAVFGWTCTFIAETDSKYGLLKQNGKTVAALGRFTQSKTTGWCVYFSTPDAHAQKLAVHDAGGDMGTVIEVFDNGFLCVGEDATEIEFGLWQPGQRTKGLELVNATGSLVWVELRAAGPAKALDFYRAAMGWTTKVAADRTVRLIPPGASYGEPLGGAGHVRQGHPPHWLPYFQVHDIDATVSAVHDNGGTSLHPATGTTAWMRDPFAGYFGLMRSAPAQ
ncbi:VOC family protein [Lentzea tibetensis]|uniref:VOC family protein n=1 Tax=Lentzea tibetensis TaxID=2591470 RepID=A0A563EWW3_9PSEU|nr:VOC family protein [Lentzea tibetensis]TWP52028.1 VOC family protein [Lentzea tibetensis]